MTRAMPLRILRMCLPCLVPAAVLVFWAFQPEGYGREAARRLGASLVEMLSILPAMFVLVGLFEVWVPREAVVKRAGAASGLGGMAWMVLLATLQAGPLYAALPVAAALLAKGASPRNVFVYLGAFSTMKLPMLAFEVGFLGWQFSLARTAMTLPVFVALAFLLERFAGPGWPGAGDGNGRRAA